MRSILKSHRRSDSSTSDFNSQLDYAFSKPQVKQNGSPVATSSAPLTPPPNHSSSQSLSSPKKLLTPIKKMFGHHPRQTGLSSAADSLNSVVFGEFEPPRTRKPIIQARSHVNLPERSQTPAAANDPQRPQLLDSRSNLSAPIIIKHTPQEASTGKIGSTNEPKIAKNSGKGSLPVIHFNTSQASLASSEKNFNLASVHRHACITGVSTESYDPDDDSRDSDNSSQFSFEKDIRGGRNTSVKYYKTKKKPGAGSKAGDGQTYFNVDQMEFEGEGLEDYDFENNGMSDEDYEDDFPGDSNRYGDFLSDQESGAGYMGEPLSHSRLSLSQVDSHEAADSAHTVEFQDMHSPISKEAPSFIGMNDRESTPINNELLASPARSPQHLATLTKNILSPGYDDDFLDSYLDKTKSPNAGSSFNDRPLPGLSLADSLPLSSEVPINSTEGLGIDLHSQGNGLGLLLNSNEPIEKRRESIVNMMDVLLKLEASTSSDQPSEEVGVGKQAAELLPTEMTKEQKRQSVLDMMNTLSLLDKQLEQEAHPATPKKELSIKRQRYSWSRIGDSQEKGDTSNSGNEESLADVPQILLDDDVLAEINSIPPDYEFDEGEAQDQGLRPEPSFFRSNSYNKKPQKVVQEFGYQGNKIETPNKTVTFYRSRSLHEHDANDSTAPSRKCSTRSLKSFKEDEEGPESQPEAQEHSLHRSVFELKLGNSPLRSNSDSMSQRSFSLEPITEADTPILK